MKTEEIIDLDISYKNKKLIGFVLSSLSIFLIGQVFSIKLMSMIGEILCLMSMFVIFAGVLLIAFHGAAYPKDFSTKGEDRL